MRYCEAPGGPYLGTINLVNARVQDGPFPYEFHIQEESVNKDSECFHFILRANSNTEKRAWLEALIDSINVGGRPNAIKTPCGTSFPTVQPQERTGSSQQHRIKDGNLRPELFANTFQNTPETQPKRDRDPKTQYKKDDEEKSLQGAIAPVAGLGSRSVNISQSIFGVDSSRGTTTITNQSLRSKLIQSTAPTSQNDPPPPHKSMSNIGDMQDKGAPLTGTVVNATAHDQNQDTTSLFNAESTMSIDSVMFLTVKQSQDITDKFTAALLNILLGKSLMPLGANSSNSALRRRMKELLKEYSKKVENDTPKTERYRRKAAKQIRLLRNGICDRFVDMCTRQSTGAPDWRIRPDLVKQAEKINPPEKTWKEKVHDWDLYYNEYSYQLPGESGPDIGAAADLVGRDRLGDEARSPRSTASLSASNSTEEDVHISKTEDEEIYNYLTSHSAFRALAQQLELLVERDYCDKMDLIRHRISLGLRRPAYQNMSGEGFSVMFYIDGWDIRTFLQEQYSALHDLGSILAITGQANNAHMSTVHEYIKRTWPNSPFSLLDAVQSAITQSPHSSSQGCNDVAVDLDEEIVTVTGSQDFIVIVAQQLAWLVASCRTSTNGLAYSCLSFREVLALHEVAQPAFSISSEVMPLESDEIRGCWNPLVGSSVIAAGFPIPARSQKEVGLEVDLEIMAHLGGTQIAMQYNGGYLLKGRSTMIVPVERKGSSVQWHLVKKVGRIRYRDIAELCSSRLSTVNLNEKDLLSTRAFLGWCAMSTNSLGTYW